MPRLAAPGPATPRPVSSPDATRHIQQEVSEGFRRGGTLARTQLLAPTSADDSPPLLCRLRADIDYPIGGARPPPKGRWIYSMKIQPCRLAGRMPVMPLLDATSPAAVEVCTNPPAGAGRGIQAESPPCMRAFRMLHDSAPPTNRRERRCETSAVVSQTLARISARNPRRSAEPVPPPSCARRMRHHRIRTSVPARIPCLVPRINIIEAEVAPSGRDVESSDGHCSNVSTSSSNLPLFTIACVPRSTRQPSMTASLYFSASAV